MATDFLRRWSDKKNASLQDNEKETIEGASLAEPEEKEIDLPSMTDADAVNFDSSVAAFLHEKVDKSVKKTALRNLFLSPEYNHIDALSDYTEDFAAVGSLEAEVAATLRNWLKKTVEEEESPAAEEIPTRSHVQDENPVDEDISNEEGVELGADKESSLTKKRVNLAQPAGQNVPKDLAKES